MNGIAALVDELGDIERELAPFKAQIKRAEVLRSTIRGAYKGHDPAASFSVEGVRWRALLTACGNESIIDLPKLFRLAGETLFVECVSASLKTLEQKCAPAIVGAVVSTRQSGSRSLVLTPVAPAPAKKAKPKPKRA